jgi:hypothetical protein
LPLAGLIRAVPIDRKTPSATLAASRALRYCRIKSCLIFDWPRAGHLPKHVAQHNGFFGACGKAHALVALDRPANRCAGDLVGPVQAESNDFQKRCLLVRIGSGASASRAIDA